MDTMYQKESDQILNSYKVVHIVGPRDYRRTGVADYAYNLAESQRNLGIDAIVLSPENFSWLSWYSTRTIADENGFPLYNFDSARILNMDIGELCNYIQGNIALFSKFLCEETVQKLNGYVDALPHDCCINHARQTFRDATNELRNCYMEIAQQRNEGLIQEYLEDLFAKEGKVPLFHIHIAPPYCGTVLSPKFYEQHCSFATIHEFKNSSKNKSTIALGFMSAVDRFAIANSIELSLADQRVPEALLPRKAVIASIPPNISPRVGDNLLPPQKRDKVCTQFTMIRPGKGIESVLRLQELAQQDPRMEDLRTNIVGAVRHPDFTQYLCDILKQIYKLDAQVIKSLGINPQIFLLQEKDVLGIEERFSLMKDAIQAASTLEKAYSGSRVEKKIDVTLYLNATDQEVADLLATSRYTYLPFKRGATYHSGTLPSCAAFGCIIATTHSSETPEEFKNGGMQLVDTPEAALEAFIDLEREALLADQIVSLTKQALPVPRWEELAEIIAGQYLQAIMGRSKFIQHLKAPTVVCQNTEAASLEKSNWTTIANGALYDEAIYALTFFGISEQNIDSIMIPSSGLSGGAALRVQSNGDDYFLKIRHNSRFPYDTCVAQHRVLQELQNTELPIPKVYGEVVNLGDKNVTLTEFVEGGVKLQISSQELAELAKTLANFHKKTQLMQERDLLMSNESLVDLLQKRLDKVGDNVEILRSNLTTLFGYSEQRADEVLQSVSQELEPIFKLLEQKLAGLPESLLHYDYSQHNVLFSDGKISSIIDFDSLRWGKSVVDLVYATYIITKTITGSSRGIFTDEGKNIAQSVISEYERVRPLTTDEKEALPYLMVARFLDSAVYRLVILTDDPPQSGKVADPWDKLEQFRNYKDLLNEPEILVELFFNTLERSR